MNRSQRIGAGVLLLGAILLAIAFTDSLPFAGGSGGQTVTARFAQASNVDTSTPVRVRGVDAGTVTHLDAAPGDTTTVVMKLTRHGITLHQDATAQIRWRTLLGGSMYIDLNPGTAGSPPLNGEIPLKRTGTQVDWDQWNSQYPAATRRSFQRMLNGLSDGLADPAGTRATATVLGPDLATTGAGLSALRGTDRGDLPALIRNSARIMSAVSSEDSALRGFVDGADRTLAVTASHNTDLAEAIRLSPAALQATETSSHTINGTLTALDPLVRRLTPGARLLGPAMRRLRPVLNRTNTVLGASEPLLKQAPGALRAVGAMSRQGTPFLQTLAPLTTKVNGELLPWLATRDDDTKLTLYEAIGPFFSALDDSLAAFDVNGPIYNFNVQASPGSILLPCDQGLSGTDVTACAAEKAAIAHAIDGGKS